MSAPQIRIKGATLQLNPEPTHQNKDTLHAVVDEVLKRSGCGLCGRLAVLHVEFAQDPDPSLSSHGVTSVTYEDV